MVGEACLGEPTVVHGPDTGCWGEYGGGEGHNGGKLGPWGFAPHFDGAKRSRERNLACFLRACRLSRSP